MLADGPEHVERTTSCSIGQLEELELGVVHCCGHSFNEQRLMVLGHLWCFKLGINQKRCNPEREDKSKDQSSDKGKLPRNALCDHQELTPVA